MTFREEWRQTAIGWRIFFTIIAVAGVTAALWMSGYYYAAGDFEDSKIALFGAAYVLGLKCWLPFTLGWAVKRRGGSFGNWAVASLLLGWLIPVIVYAARWNGKSILPQYRSAV